MNLKMLWKIGLTLWLLDIIGKQFHESNTVYNIFNILGLVGAGVFILFGTMRLITILGHPDNQKTQVNPSKSFKVFRLTIGIVVLVIATIGLILLAISQL